MNRKLGAPAGAFLGVYGVQSAFESRTSSLMTPLNRDAFGAWLCTGACSGADRAQPTIARARTVNNWFLLRSPMKRLQELSGLFVSRSEWHEAIRVPPRGAARNTGRLADRGCGPTSDGGLLCYSVGSGVDCRRGPEVRPVRWEGCRRFRRIDDRHDTCYV